MCVCVCETLCEVHSTQICKGMGSETLLGNEHSMWFRTFHLECTFLGPFKRTKMGEGENLICIHVVPYFEMMGSFQLHLW